MPRIIDFVRSLLGTRWPAGQPLFDADGRYGTRLTDGTILLAPGLEFEPLAHADDQAIQPKKGQGQAGHIHHHTEQPGAPWVSGDLKADADLGLQRMVEPLTDPEQQKPYAEQDRGCELSRDSGHGDRAAGGGDHLPPLVKTDLAQVEFAHDSLDSRSDS